MVPLQKKYVRSVPINLDRVDAVLGQASCLQEGTVVAQLHTLAGEFVSLKQLHSVVLSMLGETMNDVVSLSHGNNFHSAHSVEVQGFLLYVAATVSHVQTLKQTPL